MKQKNNWYAFSGVASSGKTTIITLLEKKGYRVIHESATEFVKQQFKKGYTIEQIRSSEQLFQKTILQLKLFYESLLNPEEVAFIDRGIPDTVAFYRLYNLPMDEAMQKEMAASSYKKVFLFERLPLIKEDFRPEPEEEIAKMDRFNEQAYRDLGHTIVKVPVMSITQRLQFILNNL